MTTEEKELLLKDLCARLPYGIMVKDRNGIHKLTVGNTEFTDLFYSNKCNIKPYLRPMSSMIEKEREEFFEKWGLDGWNIDTFDWLNTHYFDYRGLIKKGLAIEVTKDNNPYKE